MRFLPALRAHGGVWFALFIFGFESLLVANEVFRSGYAQSDYAEALSLTLFPSGPLLAAFVALRGRGFRRLHEGLPWVRSGFTIAVRSFGPVTLATVAAVLLAVVVNIRAVPQDARTLALFAVTAACLMCCAAVGFGLARLLPAAVAIPAAAGVGFLWVGVFPALGNPLLSRLATDFECCSIDSQISYSYLVGLALLAAGLTLGLLLTQIPPGWPALGWFTNLLTIGLVSVLVIGGAVGLVKSLGLVERDSLTEPRQVALDCREIEGVEYCVWPEQAGLVDGISDEVIALNAVASQTGLPTVERVGAKAEGSASLKLVTNLTSADGPPADYVRYLINRDYTYAQQGCGDVPREDLIAEERVLSLTIRTTPEGERAFDPEEFGAKSVSRAERASELPAEKYGRWFTEGFDDVDCGEG